MTGVQTCALPIYQDTTFSALLKADSGQDCYNRIIDHLKNRQDVDLRSQFPSAKGNNFEFKFITSFDATEESGTTPSNDMEDMSFSTPVEEEANNEN